MKNIDRFQDERGVWTYRDQKESEFVLWMWPKISMQSIDDFIEGLQCDTDGNRVQLPQRKRDELLEMRSEALSAYRAGAIALAEKWAAALHRACRDKGMLLVAEPLARKAVTTKRSLSKGGKKTASKRKLKAAERLKTLRAEAEKLQAMEPDIKKEALAAILSDRGYGGKAAIEKLLRLPAKKSSEGN